MLESGAIRESHSPYASPIVVVKKKDGSIRLRIDYRKLNQDTVKDSYSLPRIEESLDALKGAKWFSSLDLQSGYWQIEVAEKDIPKTAFTTPMGFTNATVCLSTKTTKRKAYAHCKKPNGNGVWNTKAFEKLVEKLTRPPILGYADYEIPFELHTDASLGGLGAALYQIQEGKKRVIAYGSRCLRKGERNYPAHKLEFLALKWAVTEKFKDYLYGREFTVLTDNNPLTYVLSTAKLDATGHRWLAALGAYNFKINYRAGVKNGDADGLSRMFIDEQSNVNNSITEVAPEAIQALCSFIEWILIHPHTVIHWPVVEAVAMGQGAVPDVLLDSVDDSSFQVLHLRNGRASEVRPSDCSGITLLDDWESPNKAERRKRLMKLYFSLGIGNVLVSKVVFYTGKRESILYPTTYHEKALHLLHDDMGHLGLERTLQFARERFYWPGMAKDIENYVKNCDRCLRRKATQPPYHKAPLVNISTTEPMELICMDYLSLEESREVIQVFLRLHQAFP
ncbi:hypothetical protein BSL78_22298 [Apostichopus japonicus]|uniref:Uncharacterized protein n=1 Tax=Stichopus japonicus TaxID=307972 RepID=A0A2G8JYP6_STIJA|nr:hypothetical protein BSL78_22298 [Apostichopus japonicus]